MNYELMEKVFISYYLQFAIGEYTISIPYFGPSDVTDADAFIAFANHIKEIRQYDSSERGEELDFYCASEDNSTYICRFMTLPVTETLTKMIGDFHCSDRRVIEKVVEHLLNTEDFSAPIVKKP